MVIGDLAADLSHAVLDGLAVAGAVHDGGVLLGDLHLTGTAQHVDGSGLQLQTHFLADDGAAGEDGDILQHLLAAVAEAGGLDAHHVQGAPQTVDDQGVQSLALNILSDDDQLLAGLDQLLQDGQDVGDDGDLLIGDEDIGVVNDGLHLLGIGDHIGGDIAPVELHAFHDLAVGLSGLGLLNGDDAVGGNLLHGIGDQLADLLVAAGNSADTGDVVGAVHLLGLLLDLSHGGLHSLGHALLHHDGVGTGGQVLQTLVDHGLGQQGSGGGAVAGHVVGLGGDFLHQLRAHVLKGIGQLHLPWRC